MGFAHHGMRYLLNIAIGSAVSLGGSYIFSRIKEQQETETRLAKLEYLLEELAVVEEKKKKKKKSKAAQKKAPKKE